MKKRFIYRSIILGLLLLSAVSILFFLSLPRHKTFQKEITTSFGDTLILVAELYDLKDQQWSYSVELPSGRGLGVDCHPMVTPQAFKKDPASFLKEIHHAEGVNVYQFGDVLFYVAEDDIASYAKKTSAPSVPAFEALFQTKNLCYLNEYFDVFLSLDLPECRALAERWAMQNHTEEEVRINQTAGYNTLDMRFWAGEYLARLG